MTKEITRKDKILAFINRTLEYNIAELVFISYLLIHPHMFIDQPFYAPVMWVAFAMAAIWVLLLLRPDAGGDIKEGLREGWLYVTDFFTNAIIMILIAILVRNEGWQFWSLYLLIAGVNLRMTHFGVYYLLAVDKLREDQTDKTKQSGSDSTD